MVEAPRNRWITAASEARTESGGDAVAFVKLLTGVDGWTLKFEKGNVRVWARQVAGSKFKEVRGNGIVDAPPAKVLAPNPNPNPNTNLTLTLTLTLTLALTLTLTLTLTLALTLALTLTLTLTLALTLTLNMTRPSRHCSPRCAMACR